MSYYPHHPPPTPGNPAWNTHPKEEDKWSEHPTSQQNTASGLPSKIRCLVSHTDPECRTAPVDSDSRPIPVPGQLPKNQAPSSASGPTFQAKNQSPRHQACPGGSKYNVHISEPRPQTHPQASEACLKTLAVNPTTDSTKWLSLAFTTEARGKDWKRCLLL